MADLGLNDQHQSLVQNYVRFAKQQRMQNLKAVECSFQDVIDSRLLEQTYTSEEVRELLLGLQATVRADVETELMAQSRMTALLLKQLLVQAQRWHLPLSADFSQLLDREQLEQVARLEEGSGGPPEKTALAPVGGRLAPLGATADRDGGVALLTEEVRRLERNATELKEQLQESTLLAQVRQQQIIRLNEELDSVRGKLATAAAAAAKPPHVPEATEQVEQTDEVVQELSKLSLNLSDSEAAREDLRLRLEAAERDLQRTNARLTLAEKELQSKFNETTAYANMKRMLATKNQQLRELRTRLTNLTDCADNEAVLEDDD